MDYQLQKNTRESPLEPLKIPLLDSAAMNPSIGEKRSKLDIFDYINPASGLDEIEETKSYHLQHALSSSSKKIRKVTEKREKYNLISNEVRLELIDAVIHRGEKMNHAAKRLNINYSSAKSIFQVYKKEGRADKKSSKKELSRSKGLETLIDEVKFQKISSGIGSVSTSDGLQISQNNSSPRSEQFEEKRLETTPLTPTERSKQEAVSPQVTPQKTSFQTPNSAFSKYSKKEKENEENEINKREEIQRIPPFPLLSLQSMASGLQKSSNQGLAQDGVFESVFDLISARSRLQNSFFSNLFGNAKHNILPFEHQI